MKAEMKVRGILDICLSTLCVIIFMALVVVGTYQIVVRYLFNSPSTMSEELLTYGFTWMSLLAAALVFGKREHMRMGFLADKLKGTARLVLEVLIELLILAFSAIVMVYGGKEIVKLTMSQQTASLGIAMGVVYVAVLVSGICIVIYAVLNIIALVTGNKPKLADANFDEKQLRDKALPPKEVLRGKGQLEQRERTGRKEES